MVNGQFFFGAALALYALGTLHYLLHLFWQRELVVKVGYRLVLAGFASQTVFFFLRMAAGRYFPVSNLFEAVAFFAWSIILLFLIYEQRFRLAVTGAFVVPVALVMMISAAMLDKAIVPLPPALQSHWLGLHTSVSFIAYAAFVITFACGLMYLIQERQLKKRRSGLLYRQLPSLEVLDRINYHSLTIGFACLTVGIITGAVWAEQAWGTYWSWDPKETWSLVTWFIYAALLHARLTIGWRGRRAAYLAIVGFAAVIFTFLGVNLLHDSLHAYN